LDVVLAADSAGLMMMMMMMMINFLPCPPLSTVSLFIVSIHSNPTYSDKLEKLSAIEDRGQTDRVTALPRPYTLDIDL